MRNKAISLLMGGIKYYIVIVVSVVLIGGYVPAIKELIMGVKA